MLLRHRLLIGWLAAEHPARQVADGAAHALAALLTASEAANCLAQAALLRLNRALLWWRHLLRRLLLRHGLLHRLLDRGGLL